MLVCSHGLLHMLVLVSAVARVEFVFILKTIVATWHT
jgi:hypothetical protein